MYLECWECIFRFASDGGHGVARYLKCKVLLRLFWILNLEAGDENWIKYEPSMKHGRTIKLSLSQRAYRSQLYKELLM